MDDLKKNLTTVAASLQVLGANTMSNTRATELLTEQMTDVSQKQEQMSREMEQMSRETQRMALEMSRMTARNRETEAAVQSLQGTFASIEVHMMTQLELSTDQRIELDALKQRVEVLERRQPPAA